MVRRARPDRGARLAVLLLRPHQVALIHTHHTSSVYFSIGLCRFLSPLSFDDYSFSFSSYLLKGTTLLRCVVVDVDDDVVVVVVFVV